jgi:inorganic pyrophosphatase
MKYNLALVCLLMFSSQVLSRDAVRSEASLAAPDQYTLIAEKSFLSGYEAKNRDGSVNVIVEIPAGTTAKWEVTKPQGQLKWEFRGEKPREVNYLGYPGNYGMIPQTILPKALGGDGDPLDVIVLGHAVARGSVIQAKIIGVLRLLDRREQDDKLIAVMAGTPLYEINSLSELDQRYIGASLIVETWFANYKGPGKMQSRGYGDNNEAYKILDAAISAYKKQK